MRSSRVLYLATCLAVVKAHFLLNYPQTRGFDEDKEPQFCGGFLLTNRSQFPLSGGIVSITSEHPKAEVDIQVSFDANPTKFSQFNKTGSGTTIPFLVPFTVMNAQGDACFPVNISSLGLADAKNGVNATILVQFNGGDGTLFQCADVTLSDNFTVPSQTKCDNATGAFSTPTAPANTSTTGSASPTGAHSSSASMLTVGATALVGIWAGVLALIL